jgi:hypothetical protein
MMLLSMIAYKLLYSSRYNAANNFLLRYVKYVSQHTFSEYLFT